MKYKQYLHSIFEGHQRICAAADIDLTVPGDPLTGLNLGCCRQVKVRFVVDEGATADHDDLPIFSAPPPSEGDNGDDHEPDHIFALYYVSTLDVASPDRRLLDVELRDGHIDFHIGIFDDDGNQYHYVTVCLDYLPRRMKLIVTMEPLECLSDSELGAVIGTPDVYEVRNLAERSEPMKIVVDELRHSELRRTRELGEDEKGKFEIITEP